MSSPDLPAGSTYEVALPGEFGPAVLATFASLGVRHAATSSVFLLPVPADQGVCDVAAMLQARGLEILDIRRVGCPSGGIRSGSSGAGDDSPGAGGKREDRTRHARGE